MRYAFTILHNSECNFWLNLKSEIKGYAERKNLDFVIEDVLISNDEEARKWKFAGSPKLLINGIDVNPMADKITNYHASGCLPIVFKGKFYESVPIELVDEVIRRNKQ